MSEADVIKAGISAFQSGDRAKAAALFAQVVKQNPASEQGWYMLGMSVSSPEQREYCLKRVLAINPNNQHARRQLTPPSAPPAAPFTLPSPHFEPVSQRHKPFTEEEPKTESAASAEDQLGTSAPKPVAVEKSHPVEAKKTSTRKKQNNSRVIVYSLAASLFIGLCTLSAAFFILRNSLFTASTQVLPRSVATQTLPPLLPTATIGVAPPTALPSPLPTVAYTPNFEEISCWFDTFEGVDVRCGYAIVPESRSGDPSDTIQLAVAVFKGKNSSQTPVIFLQGGPGAEAVQLSMDAYDVLVQPFLKDRDFIVFDQRGTGYSEPALKCDELQKTYRQDIYGTIPAETRRLVYGNSFLSCNGLLLAEGVNLNAYTTMESAADLKDIVQMLGYSKVHLYGASYGTRLAQVVMREYPEIVETAVLELSGPGRIQFLQELPGSHSGWASDVVPSLYDGREMQYGIPQPGDRVLGYV